MFFYVLGASTTLGLSKSAGGVALSASAIFVSSLMITDNSSTPILLLLIFSIIPFIFFFSSASVSFFS